jgi:hypothetical protein
MLRGFRELGLSAPGLRVSVARLREQLNDEYALATQRLATDRGEPTGRYGCLIRRADVGTIDHYLRFVTWSKDRYPTRLKLKTYQGADVIVDLRFAFG